MIHKSELSRAYYRLAVGARVWTLLILGIPTVSLGDSISAHTLAALGLVWALVTLADWRDLAWLVRSPLEAALVGAVVAHTVDARPLVLLALVVPPFTGGLLHGTRGVAQTTLTEVLVVIALTETMYGGVEVNHSANILTWIFTALGLGLIASYLHTTVLREPPDALAPYREAQTHIRGLLRLSGDLRSGLDAVTLGSRIAVEVRNALPVAAVAIYVPREDALTPLVSGAIANSVDQSLLEPLGNRAWLAQEPVIEEERFALPLSTDVGIVAVAAGMLAAGRDLGTMDMTGRLGALARSLTPNAVQLNTALLFQRLRDAATADERRRLARDLHDGVAQDIASLGYLVDALAAAPSTPAQAETLRRLRERVTDVVAQVRLSVQTLRTDAESAESLGAAISGLARHLSDSSGVPIRVSADERTTRLRPEVEGELLRIAQEAMTNAVRHANPGLIEVTCRVAAPFAEITVRDDGAGLGAPRSDSYGLKIMKERADLIDADFDISPGDPRGTVVTVRVPSRYQSASRVSEDRQDRVSL